MKIFYRCTSRGYCPGQSWRHVCKTANHPERLKCPNLKIIEAGPTPKPEIDSKEDGREPLDPALPWNVSLWAVRELMKERRPGESHL